MDKRIYRLARAGGIDTNPTLFMQRAGTFASAATEYGTATLLTRRSANDMNGYLILTGKGTDTSAALQLAQTVGARAEEDELPTDLGETDVIGTLTYLPSPAMRETQAGLDPTELPRMLANAMPAGTWVSVTMRKPGNRERKFYTTWLANRLGTAIPTHHSTSPTAVAVTITAGGSSRDEVRALLHQVAAGMPGFDLDSDASFPPRYAKAVVGLPAGLVTAAALLFGLPFAPDIAAAIGGATGFLYGLATVLTIVGVLAVTGKIKSPDTRLRDKLDTASFPAPAIRGGKPAAPRKERIVKSQAVINGEKVTREKLIAASDGDYPLHRDVFLLGPSVIAGMVSPHAGAISGDPGSDRCPDPQSWSSMARTGPRSGVRVAEIPTWTRGPPRPRRQGCPGPAGTITE